MHGVHRNVDITVACSYFESFAEAITEYAIVTLDTIIMHIQSFQIKVLINIITPNLEYTQIHI